MWPRGYDVPGISHVINFDAPRQTEDFHRIGRAGRAGVAVTLLASRAAPHAQHRALHRQPTPRRRHSGPRA